jgi:hypothetical protein
VITGRAVSTKCPLWNRQDGFMALSPAEHEQQTRTERARAIGLFRYQLIREAADPVGCQKSATVVTCTPVREPSYGQVVLLERVQIGVHEWSRRSSNAHVSVRDPSFRHPQAGGWTPPPHGGAPRGSCAVRPRAYTDRP